MLQKKILQNFFSMEKFKMFKKGPFMIESFVMLAHLIVIAPL